MDTPSKSVGVQMLEAMGLPVKRCVGFRIICSPNDVIRVEAEYHPDGDFSKLTQLIRVFDERRR